MAKSTGTFRVAICGMTASSSRGYALGANITSITEVTSSSTTPPFNTDARGCEYVQVVVGTDGTGVANRVTIS